MISLTFVYFFGKWFNFSSGEEPSNLGGRFSKSSMERERILQRRKEHMLLMARRKYFEKHQNRQSESYGVTADSTSSSSSSSGITDNLSSIINVSHN